MPNNELIPSAVKVKLSRPIKVGGEEVDELTVHEPQVKHLPMIDQLRLGGEAETGAIVVTNLGSVIKTGIEQLCGLTPGEANQISIPDAMKIGGVVMGFFGFALPDLGAIKSGL
ncbi:MAG: phage tail assembly protein [Pseudomonadota bacterium]